MEEGAKAGNLAASDRPVQQTDGVVGCCTGDIGAPLVAIEAILPAIDEERLTVFIESKA